MSTNAGDPPAWAAEPVHLSDADPTWALRGTEECHHLEAVLASWLVGPVEHVGSTAIPGLVAKPIIDLQAPVRVLTDVSSIVAALNPHAWHFVDPALDQRPWRRFFVKVIGGKRSAHLHVMTANSRRWCEQLAFRDALRGDPALVAQYAELKRALATAHRDNREAYSAAKTEFVLSVVRSQS
jgi:GrpB-like predicted nucleotidyltransferase (UPF0157 family)